MDISSILNAFPFEPGRPNVRLITGDDGEPKIQVRLDLGILQMNTEGRPDGKHPFGYDSLLEYHEDRLDHWLRGETFPEPTPEEGDGSDSSEPAAEVEASAGGAEAAEGAIEGVEPDDEAHAEAAGGGDARDRVEEPSEEDVEEGAEEGGDEGGVSRERGRGRARFVLTPEDCEALRSEAVMYYQRYMALLALEEFEGVIRDTTRNLRALDLCRDYGQTEQDRQALEQFRPYIMMVRSRAIAGQAIKDNEPKAALHAIDDGLEALRQYFADQGEPDLFDQSAEVQMLKGMREALVPKLPVSQLSELRSRLARAIEQENYELAAILRDELRMLEKD